MKLRKKNGLVLIFMTAFFITCKHQVEQDFSSASFEKKPIKISQQQPYFFLAPIFKNTSGNKYQFKNLVTKKFFLNALYELKDNNKSSKAISQKSSYTALENQWIEKINQFDFKDLFIPASKNKVHYSDKLPEDLKKKEQEKMDLYECKIVLSNGKIIYEEPLTDHSKYKDKIRTGDLFSYCVAQDAFTDFSSLFFYFHGVGGQPSDFMDRISTYQVREKIRAKTKQPPLWISLSFGLTETFLGEGRESLFFNLMIPYLMNKYKIVEEDAVKNRWVMGVSMGGLNATYLTVTKPKFSTATTLVCPAINPVDDFNSQKEMDSYVKRTNAMELLTDFAFWVRPSELDSFDYYTKVDPLYMGQKTISEKTPPMLVQASSIDQFGFAEGNRLITLLARTQGADVTFQEYEGTHCVLNPEEISNFFMKHRK